MDSSTITLLIALGINCMGLVWGAAKISASVERLTKWADKTGDQVNNHETRITVLETRREDDR